MEADLSPMVSGFVSPAALCKRIILKSRLPMECACCLESCHCVALVQLGLHTKQCGDVMFGRQAVSSLQEALLPALEALSPEHFESAMSLVHTRYPGLPTGPGEEMQFDITCLDSLALRQLMDLTQACARAAKVSHATLGCFCIKGFAL